jgi:D-amino-acid dehydrogenase
VGDGWRQWLWGLRFLAQCNDLAFERNVAQLVALGNYSHAVLKELVAATGIDFQRVERGIAHYFTDEAAFDAARRAAALMRLHGVQRRVISREELLAIEPALQPFADRIVGGTFAPSDESGNAREFTEQLARRCEARGARFLFGRDVERLEVEGGVLDGVRVRDRATGGALSMAADAVVVACGSYSEPLLRAAGLRLPICPGKGYSATFPLLRPEAAPWVSLLDDEVKRAMSRMGDRLRVAGTIEMAGFDTRLDTPVARARCRLLSRRVEQVLPGVCDTRDLAEGGDPQWWCGLRPATPTNVPYIGRTRIAGLWVNTGHGTLGWTHGAGSGKALAELVSGKRPPIAFDFLGFDRALRVMPMGA